MLLERLFGSREPLETSLKDVEEFFRERKREELDAVEASTEDFQQDIGEALEELVDFLEDIEGYTDEKNRKVIEDVVDNIVGDRIALAEDFEYPDSPRELHEELELFISRFQEMKQKEAAVLEETHLGKKLTRKLKPLEELEKELEQFLEEEYVVKERHDKITERLEKIDELKSEKEEMERELSSIDLGEKKQELSDIEEEIEEFREGNEWKDYQELNDRLEKLEDEQEELKAEVGKAMSRMERGLKKLVYRIENTDLEFDGETGILKDIRDGNRKEILENQGEVEKSVSEAVETLPEELLGDRQRQKFVDGAEKLEEVGDLKDSIEGLEGKIEDTEEELEGHEAIEKLEELKEKKEDLKGEIAKAESRREELDQRIGEKRERIEELEKELNDAVNESFEREVSFS